ncbi:MAG: hypothetical protein KME13_03155 [Myxacorys californica WJT36-NPBG1]|jgi:hypothetical protein|nr:hypothetical protein [Myxacorys californica WJT36-NPBG1]
MQLLLKTLETELDSISPKIGITLEGVPNQVETETRSLSATGDRYWVPWTEDIGAWVTANGSAIHVLVRESAEELDARELVLGFSSVLTGICLNLQGRVAIHANAVSLRGVAVAFVGYSGMGKSTLSAYCASRGAGFVTDDVLVVDDRNHVTLGNPRIKLYPETGEQLGLDASAETAYKIFYAPEQLGAVQHHHPVPLGALYLLAESDDEIYTEALPATQAIFDLLIHGYDVNEFLPKHPDLLDAYVRLVQQVPVKTLYYPRSFDRLPDVYTFMLKELQSP